MGASKLVEDDDPFGVGFKTCDRCEGTGRLAEAEPCSDCNGTGFVPDLPEGFVPDDDEFQRG